MALVLMILGFIWWWPLGLIILGVLLARGRLGCWHRPAYAGSGPMGGCEHSMDRWENKMARMQEKMDRARAKMERFKSRGDWWGQPSSGNRAFDDYRAETLRRLEDEQREFKEFLERLRFAKDRAEFDQFMNERRNRPADEAPQPQPQA
ncbi:MAG TPA: DUF2852 domain-containing protein [Xanthobacteraceae bacterium]|nr:DUF2852 domain-containing protein [Xanthobacteraceae bacterium]